MGVSTKTSSESPRSPDRTAIQRLACNALQSRSVSVESLDGYVFRTYRLRTSQGFFYILRCRPSSGINLLRHEDGWLDAEAGVLQTFAGRSDIRLPRLISYQNAESNPFNTHLISGPFSGSILSDVEPSLSSRDLASIDQSLGQYVRGLSSISGQLFGPVWGAQGIPRKDSWAKTFAFLLEAVMRDGEDAMISLPYDGIRDLVQKHRSTLDKITIPRLLLIELASDKNVIVDPKGHRIIGLMDFSTAIYGDPFMSDCFSEPTASFVEGFGRLPNKSTEERIRQYLYVLYHSLLAVVRQWYRPSDDRDEMEARRTLTIAIRQLSGRWCFRRVERFVYGWRIPPEGWFDGKMISFGGVRDDMNLFLRTPGMRSLLATE